MREEQNKPAHLSPFCFCTRDVLVNYSLRSIHKVPELRLPDSQRIRIGDGIAVLKAQHRKFGEQRVVNAEIALAFPETAQAVVLCVRFLMMQHCMPVTECA